MATRGAPSKRQAATYAIEKIQNVLADENSSESKDAGGRRRGKYAKKHTNPSTTTAAKMPKATRKKAKGGPEIVKVVRPDFTVANQQKKKARQNPAVGTNQVPVQRATVPVVEVRNDRGDQYGYCNGYLIGQQSGAFARGMKADAAPQFLYEHADRHRGYHNVHLNRAPAKEMGHEDDFELEEEDTAIELTASAIRQCEHEMHQVRRAGRSKHQYKNRLSYKMRSKIRQGNERSLHTPEYSPIRPLSLAEFHFSPNPGSPPINLDWLFDLELEEGDEEFDEMLRYMGDIEEL